MLFGTDICHVSQELPGRALLTRWRDEGKISETVFQKVARGNAIKLLGLE
jgi:uncharacterized protein